MANESNKIIFILGHGRSGTTLLNKVLTAHPRIHFINWEFNFFGDLYQQNNRYDKYGPKKFRRITEKFFKYTKIIQTGFIDFPYGEINWSKINNFRNWLDLIFDFFRNKSGKPIIGVKVANN